MTSLSMGRKTTVCVNIFMYAIRMYHNMNVSYVSYHFEQDGKSTLHHAVIQGELDVVKRLVEYGCDVNIKDEVGRHY